MLLALMFHLFCEACEHAFYHPIGFELSVWVRVRELEKERLHELMFEWCRASWE